MAIRDLDELASGEALTDEQIHALIAKYTVKLHNIMFPCGDTEDDILAGVDYKENGDVGHEMSVSTLVQQLRGIIKDLQEALEKPELRGDIQMYTSQWDNPDL